MQVFLAEERVWTLCKNWSMDWNELDEDNVIHKYDVGVVLEFYNKKIKWVNVSPSVKIIGFTQYFASIWTQ